MDSLIQDLRYAIRVLRRNGAFTLAAVVTLALGIGATAGIFTVVNAVLLRPLPFGDPDRLVMLWMENRTENIEKDVTSYPTFLDWRSESRAFESMAAVARRRFNMTEGAGEPEEIQAAAVSAEFFEVMRIPMVSGRGFLPEEEVRGNERVAVLSHGLWQRRFGGERDMLGRTLQLSGQPHVVVGVAGPGVRYPEASELWVPLAPDSASAASRGSLWLSVIGRLAPDATVQAAQVEMSGIAARLEEEYTQNRGQGVLLEPLHETVVGGVRPALLVLFGAVGFVLLIACANVANLLLARGAARQREVAVRLAIGAGGGRLARQMLTESVVLALLGGLLGLALAAFGVRALGMAAPADIPRIDGLRVDRTITLFTFFVALATGILFGVAPALQARRASLSSVLRDEERGASGRVGRVRPILVMAQVALALVLLTGAGLMIRTFHALESVDPGFSPEGLLSARLTLPSARYPEGVQVVDFFARLEESLAALPGVESVGAVSNVFLSRLPNMAGITAEGAAPAGPDDPVVSVVYDAATPAFFETFGLRLLAGTVPTGLEDTNSPSVAVVNQTFVREFMADGDPLGRRFTFGNPDNAQADWITVIGVVADARRAGPTEPVRPEAYMPHRQFTARGMTVLVRTSGDPLDAAAALRGAVRGLDPELPIANLTTVDRLMAQAQSTRRFVLALLLLFAGVAAVLAAIGIYGVMAYLVSRRTREVGVRMAVGADRSDVVGLILRDAARQVLPGIGIGLVGAIALARLLRSQLFGVGPTDPVTLAAVAAVLTTIALLASWIPAHRASRTDPLDALRSE